MRGFVWLFFFGFPVHHEPVHRWLAILQLLHLPAMQNHQFDFPAVDASRRQIDSSSPQPVVLVIVVALADTDQI